MTDFVDMTALKDDLGITGSADDAWLERRVANVLEAMQVYSGAYIGPVADWEDDWSRIVVRGRLVLAPFWPLHGRASPYLTHAPVTAITAAFQGTTTVDVAKVLFEPKTGELLSMTGAPVSDLERHLVPELTRIQYSAGYETLPGDLYEALVGITRDLLAIRRGSSLGVGSGAMAIKSITIADVGTVALGGAAGQFESAAMRGGGPAEPLLGPWAASLGPYRDLAGLIGDRGRPSSKSL